MAYMDLYGPPWLLFPERPLNSITHLLTPKYELKTLHSLGVSSDFLVWSVSPVTGKTRFDKSVQNEYEAQFVLYPVV